MPIRLHVVTEPRPGDQLFPYNLMILALEDAIATAEPVQAVASDYEVSHKVDLALPVATLAPLPASSPVPDRVDQLPDATLMGQNTSGFKLLCWNHVHLGAIQGIRVPVRRDPEGGNTVRVVIKSQTLEASPTTPAGTLLEFDQPVALS